MTLRACIYWTWLVACSLVVLHTVAAKVTATATLAELVWR